MNTFPSNKGMSSLAHIYHPLMYTLVLAIMSMIHAWWKSCSSLFKFWREVYLSSIKVMFTLNIGPLSRKYACGHDVSSVWGRQWLFSFLVRFIANNCLIIIVDAQNNFCHQVHILFLICSHFLYKSVEFHWRISWKW